jgi:hypothetical protein
MEDTSMTKQLENTSMYREIAENRMLMYSKPKRYFNRSGKKGPAFRFLFLVEIMVICLLMAATGIASGQEASTNQIALVSAHTTNIYNYTTVYNSGKVFVNWTARQEPADCIYIVERSSDGRTFESVGVKEGIGTDLELFYSWMDHTPPAGFAFYRVKKITKDGTQMYSSTNTVINQGSSFDEKSNYARGAQPGNSK